MSSNRLTKLLILLFGLTLVTMLASATLAKGTIPVDQLADGFDLSVFDETALSSNLFTQPDDLSLVENYLTVPADFVLCGETADYQLYFEEGSYAIRIVDRMNGFIYGSSLDDKDEGLPNFNTTWEGIVNSAAVIKYYVYNDLTGAYTTVEESMFKNPATTATHTLISGGFSVRIEYADSGIGLTLQVYLDETGLHVVIPQESITESSAYPLRSVKVYSFLGSVYGDSVPGYVFVPDGPGALIRYRPIDTITDVYEFVYYGTDQGIKAEVPGEASLSMPVYGMVQGIDQHGFLGVIASGDAFASLVVNPAKNNLKYYYAHPEFLYRSLYASPTSEAAANSGSGQTVVQADRNDCDVHMIYRFLRNEAANYVGMANSYRDYLSEEAVLHDLALSNTSIPAYIELIGAETKQGFLFDELQIMTSVDDAEQILADLSESIDRLTVVYKGAFAGGFSASGLTYQQLNKALGSLAAFRRLAELYSENGDAFALYADVLKVYETGTFNQYRDLSIRVNGRLLEGLSFTTRAYYTNPIRASELSIALSEELLNDGFDTIALGTIGYLLYSDFTDGFLDRQAVMDLFASLIQQNAGTTLLYRPNAYLWNGLEEYLLAPSTTMHYEIYTDQVPFLSVVLAGKMETYSSYLNFAANRTDTILKLIDYNLYPSFILTEASAYRLQDTELAALYSSSYATWKADIALIYESVNTSLQLVIGQAITTRVVPSSGIALVTYENGVVVMTNYTNDDYTSGEILLPARSAVAVMPHE